MKRSQRSHLLVFAAGVSLLALPAWAQSSGSGSTTGSGTDLAQPPATYPGSITSPATSIDQSTATRPGVGSANDPSRTVPGDNPGSLGAATVRSSEPVTPRTGEGMNNGTHIGVSAGANFDKLDTDRDGRLSLYEYAETSMGSAASAFPSQSQAAVSAQSRTSGNLDSGDESTGGRSGATTGIAGEGQYANPATEFRRLDTNGDGFLSREEVTGGDNRRGEVKP